MILVFPICISSGIKEEELKSINDYLVALNGLYNKAAIVITRSENSSKTYRTELIDSLRSVLVNYIHDEHINDIRIFFSGAIPDEPKPCDTTYLDRRRRLFGKSLLPKLVTDSNEANKERNIRINLIKKRLDKYRNTILKFFTN